MPDKTLNRISDLTHLVLYADDKRIAAPADVLVSEPYEEDGGTFVDLVATVPGIGEVHPTNTVSVFHEKEHRFVLPGFMCMRTKMVFDNGPFTRIDARACVKKPPGWV